ncbi:hypothetical protein [Alloactinosynnema sp. L-07]|uniref:DUF3105 domain-containing protein n=1 Tax=Alloactinosynnema sp. L-07 TaxID=1653480 RepID=UPI00065EF50D|nr:DUF3105 domain-containing protein [Alloactinosynnema sp. L-07]CRK59168.1 hypothetical protein [Alloactinosynnema sp. L-07]
MIAPARRLALAAACLLLTACGTTETGKPVAAPDAAAKPTKAAPTSKPGRGFAPSEADRDPTKKIDGVVAKEYAAGQHVAAPKRVAYDHLPPLGGAHDQIWAPCNGEVYDSAVRTEHLVHSLEHGAVWVTYDPATVRGDDVEALAERVDGKPYLVMSPFPGQKKPVSVQSWGRQLQVDAVDDERIDQFIAATRANKYLAPEPGASCDPVDVQLFDPAAPPPFDPTPAGPDAAPVTGAPTTTAGG